MLLSEHLGFSSRFPVVFVANDFVVWKKVIKQTLISVMQGDIYGRCLANAPLREGPSSRPFSFEGKIPGTARDSAVRVDNLYQRLYKFRPLPLPHVNRSIQYHISTIAE